MKAGAESILLASSHNFRRLFSRRYGECNRFHRYQNSGEWQVAGSEINSRVQQSHLDRYADDPLWDRGSFVEPREAILVLWQHLAIKVTFGDR
jgi:hypothetical protein